MILTHLAINHRSLSTIVDAPEPLWYAGACDEVGTGKDEPRAHSGHERGRKPVSACASSGLTAVLTAEASDRDGAESACEDRDNGMDALRTQVT